MLMANNVGIVMVYYIGGNGPAIIYANGEQVWYQHGILHRDNGPAVIYANGEQRWYQHDIQYFP